jgi:hypothetical protein
VPAPLAYATSPTFRRRRSARLAAATMLVSATATAGGLVAIFESAGRGGWDFWIVYVAAAFLFAVGCAIAIPRLIRGGHWETRIEAGTLHLTRPGGPTEAVPLDDVTHFVTLATTTLDHETTITHHLRLRDGRTVPLAGHALGWLPTFRRALLRVNPSIEPAREKARAGAARASAE